MTKHYIPAMLWLLFITGLSVVPKMQLPEFDLFSVDKIGHVAAYALLVWLLLLGVSRANRRNANWKEGALIFGVAVLYGVLIEFVQGNFIPGRLFGYDDMLANTAGAAAAWALAGFTQKRATRP